MEVIVYPYEVTIPPPYHIFPSLLPLSLPSPPLPFSISIPPPPTPTPYPPLYPPPLTITLLVLCSRGQWKVRKGGRKRATLCTQLYRNMIRLCEIHVDLNTQTL